MTFRAAMYKGTPRGYRGIYNRLVRWWTRSIYSHGELAFSSGMSASASWMDHGVRTKRIIYDPNHWDFIDLPAALEPAALQWFKAHDKEKYDLIGNLQFILARLGHSRRRWFCSEAMAAALGIPDPWRYDPGTIASALRFSNQPALSGIST